jgi:GDP-L-fucose synthase
MIPKNSKIFVAGHKGLIGSAIVRELEKQDYSNVLRIPKKNLDLSIESEVYEYFHEFRPEYVFLAAAKVGGILSEDTNPTELLLENLKIQCNVIGAALEYKVKKLIFFGSSVVMGYDEKHKSYAAAKIAGLHLCENIYRQYGVPFITVIPPSVYGPNDNYDLNRCHIIAAFVRRIHEAKLENAESVTLWGDGSSHYEVLYSDDVARASIEVLNDWERNTVCQLGQNFSDSFSANLLAPLIKEEIGYQGTIKFSLEAGPNGSPRKLLAPYKTWKKKISIEEGIALTYKDFLKRFQK